MGNILSDFFGGSQSQQSSKSNSYNQAYPYLQGALSPTVSNGTGASSQIANMLGLNGNQAQNQGFNNWKNSTGYQFGLNQGVQSIVGNAATQGLLNSGSTAKAVDTYGQNYANTQYQNYLNPLLSLMQGGTSAASVIGNAGNVYNSSSQGTSSQSNGGLGSFFNK